MELLWGLVPCSQRAALPLWWGLAVLLLVPQVLRHAARVLLLAVPRLEHVLLVELPAAEAVAWEPP